MALSRDADLHFDTTQIELLAKDLRSADDRVHRAASATLKKGAVKIKRGMKRDFANTRGVAGHKGYYPHIAKAINFDQLGPLAYEIGIDKGQSGDQGDLGNILAFGSANNAPVVDHTAALRREAPLVLHHLALDAQESVLGGRR